MRTYLAVGGAVGLDGPACLVAEHPEHLIVVAVPGQLVVAVGAQPAEDLRRDRTPAALAAPVVLPLLPRRHPHRQASAASLAPSRSLSLSASVHLPPSSTLASSARRVGARELPMAVGVVGAVLWCLAVK
jgi:hypothetical protein